MKNILTVLLSALIICFAITGCRQTINIDIPFDSSKVVLNALIEKDSLICVRLTKPLSVLHPDNNFQEIINAKIDLYENAVFKETLKEKSINGKLYYVSDLSTTAGNSYTIKASGTFGNAESTTIVPKAPTIVSAKYISYSNDNPGKIYVKIKDEKNVKNYYLLRVYSDEQTPYSTGYSYFIIENLKNQTTGIFSDFIIPDPKEIQIFDDFEFDGEDEFTLILKSFDYNNYTIELSSISESYFKYSQTLEQQRETKNDPIREKVVAYSNITGGLGIFGAINKKHLQVER